MMEKRKKFEEIREYALQISQKTGEADVASDADDIADICDNALAMPTLNCERFRTWDDAKAAYWREQGDPCDWRRLGAWLFSQMDLGVQGGQGCLS